MCLLDHEFNKEYEIELSAWGEGILNEDGLLEMQKPDTILKSFEDKYHRYPKDISLLIKDPYAVGFDFGFTGIEPTFLEKLETLKELIIHDSITHIELTPKIEEILRNNSTLIRGTFDSFAERFAHGNELHFRPADFIFADFEDTRYRESTTMKLIFRRNGSVEIKETSSSPGSNAGNTFGGNFTHSLPNDFFKTQTAEQIAERFSKVACQAIIEDGRLAAFIERAKSHDFYKDKV